MNKILIGIGVILVGAILAGGYLLMDSQPDSTLEEPTQNPQGEETVDEGQTETDSSDSTNEQDTVRPEEENSPPPPPSS